MNPFATPRSAGMTAFVILFFGLAVWASVAELDYGVHAVGKVANRYPNIPIQHNATARVVSMNVTEGQIVAAGQSLLTLDDADAVAEGGRAESQRLGLRLQLDALLAEQRGVAALPPPAVALPLLPPEIVARAHAEAALALRQRLAGHRAQVAQFEGELRAVRAQLKSLDAELARIDEQSAIVRQKIDALSPLAAEGLVARNMVDDFRLQAAELERGKAARQSEQARQHAVAEQTESRRQIYLAERERDMRNRLSELEPQVRAAEQAVAAVAVRLKSQQIVAANAGQVVNVKVKAAGEVISPGMVIMELVPLQRKYFVEARILPAEIENVRAGMPAEIRFVTLPAKSTPYIDGRLASISTSSTANEKTGEETYIATVEFMADVVGAIGMEPTLGMPVEVMIKGGRRSVMNYLVEPFRVLFSRALREA